MMLYFLRQITELILFSHYRASLILYRVAQNKRKVPEEIYSTFCSKKINYHRVHKRPFRGIMMTFSIYTALIPTSIHILQNQTKILDKAVAHAKQNNIDPATMISARLTPDMFPLSRQIQIACDTVKKGAARLAAIEAPVFDDNESTIAELQIRIAKTIAFLESVHESQFIGAETRALKIPMGPEIVMDFTGQDYLNQWVLPNFYFHTTTAYDLLRQQGVALGKRDFLG
jgi:hypothetical protein